MVSVPATRTFRLANVYGGVTMHNGFPTLVLKYRDGTETKRRVDQMSDTSGAILPYTYLDLTDGIDFQSTIHGLHSVGGTFRALLLWEPHAFVDESYRRSPIAQMTVWDQAHPLANVVAEQLLAGDDWYIAPVTYVITESPYKNILPGFADRLSDGGHDVFVVDNLGRLMAWGDDWQWRIPRGFPKRDPLYNGSVLQNPVSGAIPREVDGDYLILATPQGAIYWFDISDWNTEDNPAKAKAIPYKSFFAADAKEIQDLCVDRINNRLWILTTNNELQRYDLEPFVAGATSSSNTVRAIIPVNPPYSLPHNESVTLTFQTLDMWGVRTTKSESVQFVAVQTSGDHAFYGKLWDDTIPIPAEKQIVTKTSTSGYVQVEYINHLTEAGTKPETIIARVL